ncbi:MAG: M48 family metalloprotease [Magnetococcales bacterium]|nr:M48 family metalloprotease [Magnetococcales bacterium]
MSPSCRSPLHRNSASRRQFLRLASIGSLAFLPGFGLGGCAVNPVTGKKELMLLSEGEEITIDKEQSPHQFSVDYGPVQDRRLNAYLAEVGERLTKRSHRPQAPYNYRVLNAVHVNAYTFPGGSMGVTRGILSGLENESELAALLGHEIGHVNARHAAQRQTKGILGQLVLVGVASAIGKNNSRAGEWVASLGGLASGAMLAHYSRENEREADDLGMEYMTRAGYPPKGMVGLMDLLRRTSEKQPGAVELMFATHPMSNERFQTALKQSQGRFAGFANAPEGRERFLDNTASLRRIRPAIELMQRAEKEMGKKEFPAAKVALSQALELAPEDYAGLRMMSQCHLGLDQPRKAVRYAELARESNPAEPGADLALGIARLADNAPGEAFLAFDRFEKRLPGNSTVIFLKGFSLEGQSDRRAAAEEYKRYLQQVNSGPQAQHALERLQEWGYVRRKR